MKRVKAMANSSNNYGQKRKKSCYVDEETKKACMTVIIMASYEAAQGSSYPKLNLYSSDRNYDETLTPDSDLVPKDEYLQIRFNNLLSGKKYTLEVEYNSDEKEVLFSNENYKKIVDQNMSGTKREVDKIKEMRQVPS